MLWESILSVLFSIECLQNYIVCCLHIDNKNGESRAKTFVFILLVFSNTLPSYYVLRKVLCNLYLSLTFKHLKEIAYIVSSVIIFQGGIDTLRSHYHLHFFFFYEIWNFHFIGFFIIFWERCSCLICTGNHCLQTGCMMECLLLHQTMQGESIRVTEDLGICSLQCIASVWGTAINWAWNKFGFNLATNACQQSETNHFSAPSLAYAEHFCEGRTAGVGVTTRINGVVVADWSFLLWHTLTERQCWWPKMNYFPFFRPVGWQIIYSHSSNYSSQNVYFSESKVLATATNFLWA